MELLQLRYFIKVAELENMSKAAEELNVVQSAVSRSIKRLEDDLGVQLFDRKSKKIFLNQTGRKAYKKAQDIINAVDGLYNEVSKNIKPEVIHIAIESASLMIPEMLTKYRGNNPNTEFVIHQHKDEANYDILITSVKEEPSKKDSILFKERIKLLIPQAMLSDTSICSVKLGELTNKPFLGLNQTFPLRHLVDKLTDTTALKPNYIFEADNPSVLRSAMLSGIGITFFPEKTWGQYDEKFVLVDIDGIELMRYIVIIENHRRDSVAKLCRYIKTETSKMVCHEAFKETD